MNERATLKYWNERAKNGESPQDLVLASTYLEEFESHTRKILSLFSGKVLDIGCGYGRLSDTFQDYTGIDFSDEMVKLANKKYPNKNIKIGSVHQPIEGHYDLIFEAMCLSSFEMTPEQFKDKFKNNAKIIICFEPREFTIFYI